MSGIQIEDKEIFKKMLFQNMKLTINDLKPRITVLHMIKNHILDDSFDDL